MVRIALVTQRKDALAPFAAGLAAQGMAIDWLSSSQEAVDQARSIPRDLVILDDPRGEFRPQLSALMEANALLHTAVITTMDPEAFHEASEGLGVLCSLPATPDLEHAEELAGKLGSLMGH